MYEKMSGIDSTSGMAHMYHLVFLRFSGTDHAIYSVVAATAKALEVISENLLVGFEWDRPVVSVQSTTKIIMDRYTKPNQT